MRSLLFVLTGCICSLLFVSAGVLADDYLPNNALPLAVIIKNLQRADYKVVREVEFDDGVYKVVAVNAKGQEVKLRINPETGKIPVKTIKPEPVSMLAAVQKVQPQHCTRAYKAELEYGNYTVKCLNKDGMKLKVVVSAKTGKVLGIKYDD